MVVTKEKSLLERSRSSSNLLSSSKQPDQLNLDTEQSDCYFNDRVAERFLVKRTKRSYDLSVVSKRNSLLLMVQAIRNLKRESAKIGQAMQSKGLEKNPVVSVAPKVTNRPKDRNTFATPKRYICESCTPRHKKFLMASDYFKHLRTHKLWIRCSGCNQAFNHVVHKRHHELHCPKKSKLKF